MTIIEAIDQIDSLKPNTYSARQKILWLSQLEAIVKRQVIDAHEGGEQVEFNGFDESTDVNTVLLIPSPFDISYIYWLEAQIHYYNGEMDRYNNAIILYKDLLEGFREYFHGSNKPLSRCGNRFRF